MAALEERAAPARGARWPRCARRPPPTRATTAPPSGSPRSRPSSAAWPRTATARLEAELAELEQRRAAAAAELRAARPRRPTPPRRAAARSTPRREAARRERRELDKAAEAARREAARVGAELAKVNQFLRAHAGAPGGAAALADGLSAEPGYELALAAALGPRLRAAVAADVAEGERLLDRAGRDGGAALVRRPTPRAVARPRRCRAAAPPRRRARCSTA